MTERLSKRKDLLRFDASWAWVLHMKPINLFADLPDQHPEELFQTLVQTPDVRIERIISRGQCTPAGQWYDQDTDEWVLLLQGAASLRIEREEELLQLKPGDAVLLPAHERHRVEWTDPDQNTIWLAVHFLASGNARLASRNP
jgi:cupin 2 domain-containing protein